LSQKKKIVITGGAGFIGSHLSNRLSSEFDIHIIDNLSTGDLSRIDNDVNLHLVDIYKSSLDDLAEIFSGAYAVCHLAAVKLHNEDNSSRRIQEVNLLATQKIAIACGISKVSRILFTSSLYAYGNLGPGASAESDELKPINDYGRSKAIGEEIIANIANDYGITYVIPRLYFIYGPGQFAQGGYKSVIMKNIENLKNENPLTITGSGKQELDYVYISDCVEALRLMLMSEVSGIFNVSSGHGTAVEDLISEIAGESFAEIIYTAPDWTEGTKRIGFNTELTKKFAWRPKIDIVKGIALTKESQL